jgi:hypothetical protein
MIFRLLNEQEEVIKLVDQKYERARACPSALDRSARRQGLDLGAQICKEFVAGSNGTNHTLHRTFRAFSGHLFFAEKFFVLAFILKSADATCAPRNDHTVAMGMHVTCKLKTY